MKENYPFVLMLNLIVGMILGLFSELSTNFIQIAGSGQGDGMMQFECPDSVLQYFSINQGVAAN